MCNFGPLKTGAAAPIAPLNTGILMQKVNITSSANDCVILCANDALDVSNSHLIFK